MIGTKGSVSGISTPGVLVLWVVVQWEHQFLLSYQGPFLEGSIDVGWQGPQKGVFKLALFASVLVFQYSLASKEPLQLRRKASRSRYYGFMHASKLNSVKCLVESLNGLGDKGRWSTRVGAV
eukprot:1139588-Pelagomonas_calceolata.AAC.2